MTAKKPNAAFGATVRTYRELAGRTRAEVAAKAGIDPSYWSKIEKGFVPTSDRVRAIARALDAPAGVLLQAAGYELPGGEDEEAITNAQRELLLRRLAELTEIVKNLGRS